MTFIIKKYLPVSHEKRIQSPFQRLKKIQPLFLRGRLPPPKIVQTTAPPFDSVHLLLPLNLRMILVLLTMFDQLTWLVYYIGCWVSLYLGYSANMGIGLILV